MNVKRSANPLSPQLVLEFADAWYDLEALVFQQVWKQRSPIDPITGRMGPLTTTYFSRINLFQALTGQLQNSGQQLREILTYAITQCGVNLQIGEIERRCRGSLSDPGDYVAARRS